MLSVLGTMPKMARIGVLAIGLRERSRNDIDFPILYAFTDLAKIEYRGARIRVYLGLGTIGYACLQMSPRGESFSL